MEPNRIRRIIGRNWLLIASVAIIGAAVGLQLAERSAQNIEPRFTATAPSTFEEVASLPTDEVELLLEQALVIALDANSEIILADPRNREITIDDDLLRLDFVASEPDRIDAEASAVEMRTNYLEESSQSAQLEAEQQRTVEDMEAVAAEIGQIDAAAGVDVVVEAQRRQLEGRRAGLEAIITTLELELLFPVERSIVEIQVDLNVARENLDEVRDQLRALEPTEPSPFSSESVQRRALEAEFAALEARYQELALQLSRAATPIADPVEFVDETPVPIGSTMGALIGLLMGGAFTIALLVLSDRVRRPVLMYSDLPTLRGLATVPARRDTSADTVWYERGDDPRRKAEIQAVRAALATTSANGATTVAITSASANPHLVHDLAADLAASVTMTEKRVLLMDVDFDHPGTGAEYDTSGASLAQLVLSDVPDGGFRLTDEALPGLFALPAGQPDFDPTDIMVGPRMGQLMTDAPDEFDVTIVVLPDVGLPVTKAILHRVDSAILAITPGVTSQQTVISTVNDWSPSGAKLLGYVFVEVPPITQPITRLLSSLGQSLRRMFDSATSRRTAPQEPGDAIVELGDLDPVASDETSHVYWPSSQYVGPDEPTDSETAAGATKLSGKRG